MKFARYQIEKPKRLAPVPCGKCDGEGHMEHYGHVDGGVCFRCGGSGIDPKRGWGFPESWSDDKCGAWIKSREEKRAAAAKAKADALADKRSSIAAENYRRYLGLEAAVKVVQEKRDGSEFVPFIAYQILDKVFECALSEAQASVLLQYGAPSPVGSPVPVGNGIEVSGEVLSIKLQDSQYGSSWKMLIGGDGWKVWSSVPAAAFAESGEMLISVGSQVSFVANVERSDDESFGFASRPRKLAIR